MNIPVELLKSLESQPELDLKEFVKILIGDKIYFVIEIKNQIEWAFWDADFYVRIINHIKMIYHALDFKGECEGISEAEFKFENKIFYIIKENGKIYIQPLNSDIELSIEI